MASACICVVTAKLAVGSMMDPWSPTIKFTYERKPLAFITGPGIDGASIRESAAASIRRWVAEFGTTWSGGLKALPTICRT